MTDSRCGTCAQRNVMFLVVVTLLLGVPFAWGTPSGLNNIPTTDTTPTRTIVAQTLLNFGEDTRSMLLFGFKTGVIENLEIGADWFVNGDPAQQPIFQAKYTLDLGPRLPKVGGGVANVSGNNDRNGHSMPYVVGSYDAKLIRMHGGYNFQHDNFGFFAGLDRTFGVLDRDLTLRADYIQIDNRQHSIASVGGMYSLRPHGVDKQSQSTLERILSNIIIEGWYSRASIGSLEDYFTVKLNYVIEF